MGKILMSIAQGRQSVEEFTLEFCKLAAENEWNEPALKAAFHRILNSEILSKLACQDDEATMNSLIELSIKIDNLLCDWRSVLTTLPTLDRTTIEPMQLSNTRLFLGERARRHKEGLCYYCGHSNHRITQCPKRQQSCGTDPNAKTLGVSSFLLLLLVLLPVPLCYLNTIIE